MLKVERIYNLLKNHHGKQIGGKNSTTIQVDLSLLLYTLSLEDEIKKLQGLELKNKELEYAVEEWKNKYESRT